MKNYKELKVWKLGMQIASKTYELADQLPKEERFGLRSQMTRVAISIPGNITEVRARGTDKCYKQFHEVSLGSAFELETQLLVVEDLGMLDGNVAELKTMITEEQKMLNSFVSKLKAKS